MYSMSKSPSSKKSFDKSLSLRSKHSYINIVNSDEVTNSKESIKQQKTLSKTKSRKNYVKPFNIDSKTALRTSDQNLRRGPDIEIEEIVETCGDIVSSSSNSLEFDLEAATDQSRPHLIIQSPAKYKSIEKKNINRSVSKSEYQS